MNSWKAADLYFDADTFSGVARLFPLPNLVLYPHVMQPLHIFEGRYREMLEDSLASDRLIAMALLEPGWETDYESRPPVARYACLGKVVTHHRLKDGRYNLLLDGRRPDSHRRGNAAAAIVPPGQGRALARVVRQRLGRPHRRACSASCCRAFEKHMPCGCQAPEQLREMFAQHLPLSMMTDLAAYALPFDHGAQAAIARRAACRRAGPVAARTTGEPIVGANWWARPPKFFRRHSASIDGIAPVGRLTLFFAAS